jgi:aspartyl-tRNA(Asn)/glutamyl-tRNA(Gln) amidotransferase subunit A
VDVLLTAGTWNEAPLLETMVAEANFAAPPLCSPFNIGANPTISLCNGFGPNGMPLSLQLAAAPFNEPMMFRVAHAYEQAAGWHTRRPVIPAVQAPVVPPSQLGKAATPEDRDAWRLLSDAEGLHLDPRQLDQLCEAMPHLDAMRAMVPRDLPLSVELANTFRVPAYDGADHAG